MKKLFGWLLVLSLVGAVVYYLWGCKESTGEASWSGGGE